MIETNVIQRSFSDLAPSEKAAVLSARYEKVCGTLKRDKLDAGELTLTAAVELSYLSEDEQEIAAALGDKVTDKTAKGLRAKERTDLVIKALEVWFAGKEAADVHK